jgi:hypothetical protein
MASSGCEKIWVTVKDRCALGYHIRDLGDVSDLLIEVKKREELSVGAGLLKVYQSKQSFDNNDPALISS